VYALLLTLLLLTAPSDATRGPDELDRRLAELAAPEGAVRHRAERWLTANVGPGDAERLALAARDGDPEVRHRLGRAVGGSARGLELSLLLLEVRDADVVGVAERALQARMARWNARAGEVAIVDLDLRTALERSAGESWPETVRLPLEGSLAELCALLARRGRVPVGISVAPEVADKVARSGQPEGQSLDLIGTWDEILRGLAGSFLVGLGGHAFDVDLDGATPASFVHIGPRLDGTPRTAAELLVSWCRDVTLGTSEPRRAAAARALAGSTWPEALRWLEARFLEREDPAALAGLLHAASEGRVVSAFSRPEVVARLVEGAETALAARDPARRREAFAIVDALSEVPNLAAGGDRTIGAVVLAGWERATSEGRWLRLAILEGIGAPEGRAPAAEVLAARDASGWLLSQAVRTHVAATAGREADAATPLAAPEVLLALVSGVEEVAPLARRLRAGDLAFPAGWRTPEALPGSVGSAGRAVVLLVHALAGDLEATGDHWAALLARGAANSAVAASLAEIRLEAGDVLTRAWRRRRADEPGLDRCALLAGLVPPERFAEVSRELLAAGAGSTDFEVLGAIAGRETGGESERARRTLTAKLRTALQGNPALPENRALETAKPLLAALGRAMDELRAQALQPGRTSGRAGLTGQAAAEVWRVEILRLAGAARMRGSALGALLGPGWPPPLPPRVVDLARLDRRPDRL